MVTSGPVTGNVGGSGNTTTAATPFDVAQQGGKHAGFLGNYQGRSRKEIEDSIASIEKQIAMHEGWITNPKSKIPDWETLDPRQRNALVTSKWPSDIARQREQVAILRGLLARKT